MDPVEASAPTAAPAAVLVVEDWTRFEDSIQWRIHRAYYQQRGAAAWLANEVPYLSTSNVAQTRRLARLFAALVADRGHAAAPPDDLVWVLEVGAGSGHFAANFLTALDDLDPALAARTRYVATDYSSASLRDLRASPHLAAAVGAGRVIVARLDIDAPAALDTVDGEPFALPDGARFSFVLANYLASAISQTPLQKRDGRWWDLWIETRSTAAVTSIEELALRPKAHETLRYKHSWRPLERSLADTYGPFHAALLEAAAAGVEVGTIYYPRRYFEFLRTVGPLVDDALLVTCDYGVITPRVLSGAVERWAQYYGNSIGQGLMFELFEVLAASLGCDVARSMCDGDRVHVAALGRSRIGPATRAAVDSGRMWGRHDSDSLLDFAMAARFAVDRGENLAAIRNYLACTAIDPHNARWHAGVADIALDEWLGDLAFDHIAKGRALSATGFDWDFMLGRAHVLRNDLPAAVAAYEASLAQVQHTQTLLNLAAIHRQCMRLPEALRCYRQVLTLDPKEQRAEIGIIEITTQLHTLIVR